MTAHKIKCLRSGFAAGGLRAKEAKGDKEEEEGTALRWAHLSLCLTIRPIHSSNEIHGYIKAERKKIVYTEMSKKINQH